MPSRANCFAYAAKTMLKVSMTWLLTVSKKMACLLYSLKHLLERIRLVPKHLGKEELQLVL